MGGGKRREVDCSLERKRGHWFGAREFMSCGEIEGLGGKGCAEAPLLAA